MKQNITYNWSHNELSPISKRVIIKAAQSALSYNPKRILDIGCGNGYLCQILSQHGIKCVGIDPIPEAIEQAKAIGNAGDFYVYSVYEDVKPKFLGEFDLILSTEVIEHLYLPKKLVRFAKSHLDPNGTLIITTPDYGSYWRNLFISITNRWDYHHAPLWNGGHIKFWSKKTLTRFLTEEGFSVEKWQSVRSIRLPIFNISLICHARLV